MLYPRIKAVIEKETGILVAGYVPELDFWQVGSRHLGLVLPREIENLQGPNQTAGGLPEKTLDVDKLFSLGESAKPLSLRWWQLVVPGQDREAEENPYPKPHIRLGIAWDEAFCFYYRDNLEFLEKQGAEILRFSPVHDKHLPEDLDGLLLGGGYPELYGKALEENKTMRNEIAGKQKKICLFWQSVAVIFIF